MRTARSTAKTAKRATANAGSATPRRVYVVIPAYNEATRIGDVIRSLPSTLAIRGQVFDVAVVVIDDGSKDKTYQVARRTNAHVLRHVINCGAGAATRTGLVYVSQCDDAAYAVAIDADGQHKASDVKKLVEHAIKTDADLVIGNRLHEGNRKAIPAHRKLGNWGLTLVSRILFGIKVQDTQSGLRAFKASALPAVSDYTIDRYGFATDMLWAAQRSGLKITEAPIAVTYSAETLAHGQSNWGAISLILDLLWIRISN